MAMDPSLREEQVMRILDRSNAERDLSHRIRGDHNLECLAQQRQDGDRANKAFISNIQPGRPTQNVFIARVHLTYWQAVLNRYPFRHVAEGRELTAQG